MWFPQPQAGTETAVRGPDERAPVEEFADQTTGGAGGQARALGDVGEAQDRTARGEGTCAGPVLTASYSRSAHIDSRHDSCPEAGTRACSPGPAFPRSKARPSIGSTPILRYG